MAGRLTRIACWTVCLGAVSAFVGCSNRVLRSTPGVTDDIAKCANGARPVPLQHRWRAVDTTPAATASRTHGFFRTGLNAGTGEVLTAPRPRPPARAGEAGENMLLLPMEFETDSGAKSGDANLLRLLPAYEWPRRANWRIQHMDLIVLANAPGGITGTAGNPSPVAGPRTAGLSDITHLSFFAPRTSGKVLWGAGAALGIPTATDDVLGSGKWSAGPALRCTYRNGPWNLGFVGAQRWSFAGDTNRADVNQFMVRGAFRRQLGTDWYIVSAPIITANWDETSGNRWLVPLGGGLGRKFEFAGRPWAASLQGYVNVLRPTGAPTGSIRLTMTAFIPLGP